MEGNVAEGTLMEALQAEQEGRGAQCGCGAFSHPVHVGHVVGGRPNGAFLHIRETCDDIVVRDIATELQVAVGDGAGGIGEGHQFGLQSRGERGAPPAREDGAVALWHKEDPSHAGTGRVTRAHHTGGGGNEFGNTSRTVGDVRRQGAKVIQNVVDASGKADPGPMLFWVAEGLL